MSRSYKKPIYTSGYGTKIRKEKKRTANKAVRKAAEVTNGKSYKKEYESWDICDWKIPAKKSDWKARRK